MSEFEATKSNKPSLLRIYKRLVEYSFKYKSIIFLSIISLLILAASNTSFLALLKKITDESLVEIEEFRVKMNIPKDKTYIMPAGDTRETLIEMYPKVFELCAEYGYNMTGRDHIIAYDTRRQV